jgi:hypothetical protein
MTGHIVEKKNSTFCKHRFPGSTLTHSTNEDLLNIKRKGDPYWGRLFLRAELSLIQSSCRSFIRVFVPYERGYETSGSPLRFMLRRSSLVECVSVRITGPK